MQQLTVKLEEDTDLKLAYLIEAVQALLGNPADSSAQKYIPKWVCTPPSLSRPPALTRQCFYHTPPLFRGHHQHPTHTHVSPRSCCGCAPVLGTAYVMSTLGMPAMPHVPQHLTQPHTDILSCLSQDNALVADEVTVSGSLRHAAVPHCEHCTLAGDDRSYKHPCMMSLLPPIPTPSTHACARTHTRWERVHYMMDK